MRTANTVPTREIVSDVLQQRDRQATQHDRGRATPDRLVTIHMVVSPPIPLDLRRVRRGWDSYGRRGRRHRRPSTTCPCKRVVAPEFRCYHLSILALAREILSLLLRFTKRDFNSVTVALVTDMWRD